MNNRNLDISEAVKYHYGKFPPQNIDYKKIMPYLVKATDLLARYDQMILTLHNSELFLAPLRNKEAVLSSRMEGTISTLDEILQYQADLGEQSNILRSRSDVVETLLYSIALSDAQKSINDGYKLDEFLIRATHQKLLSVGRGASKTPGEYKTEQNYLAHQNKILFIPISPEKIQDGMQNLFSYIINSDELPLIKVALAHIEFEALHPFKDGNGRIGRMLITLMLWQYKILSEPHFYISEYFEEHKDLYINAMRNVSEYDNWTDWVIFFLEAVSQQARKNLDTALKIKELYEAMKLEFGKILNHKFVINTLDFIFTNPVFRNSSFINQSLAPKQTANKITKELVKNRLLRILEEPSGRRSAMYSFEPLLNIVRV